MTAKMNKTSRAEKLVMEQLILPFYRKKRRLVGIEFEIPLFALEDMEDSRQGRVPRAEKKAKEAVCVMLRMLVQEFGFSEKTAGTDGCLVKVTKNGDTISADYYYKQIEFAMKESESLCQIQKRFRFYVQAVQEFLKGQGFLLSGVGADPFSRAEDTELTMDEYCSCYHSYMKQHTSYGSGSYFLTNMSSIQTHLDVPGGQLLDTYNFLNRVDFASGLLFSNSLWNPLAFPQNKQIPRQKCWCFRDILWRNSELPNTGCVSREFESLEELAVHMAGLKVYVKKEKGHCFAMEPQTLNEYFEKNPGSLADVSFRSFEDIALSGYHTIEIRSDCMQPIKEALAPSAFHLGLVQELAKARELAERFFQENHITQNYEELRMAAVTNAYICEEESLWNFLAGLYRLAKKGLKKRGFGEEIYLECLETRISQRMCPAAWMEWQMNQGKSMGTLLEEFAEWK